jgi:hypothetical protein
VRVPGRGQAGYSGDGGPMSMTEARRGEA